MASVKESNSIAYGQWWADKVADADDLSNQNTKEINDASLESREETIDEANDYKKDANTEIRRLPDEAEYYKDGQEYALVKDDEARENKAEYVHRIAAVTDSDGNAVKTNPYLDGSNDDILKWASVDTMLKDRAEDIQNKKNSGLSDLNPNSEFFEAAETTHNTIAELNKSLAARTKYQSYSGNLHATTKALFEELATTTKLDDFSFDMKNTGDDRIRVMNADSSMRALTRLQAQRSNNIENVKKGTFKYYGESSLRKNVDKSSSISLNMRRRTMPFLNSNKLLDKEEKPEKGKKDKDYKKKIKVNTGLNALANLVDVGPDASQGLGADGKTPLTIRYLIKDEKNGLNIAKNAKDMIHYILAFDYNSKKYVGSCFNKITIDAVEINGEEVVNKSRVKLTNIVEGLSLLTGPVAFAPTIRRGDFGYRVFDKLRAGIMQYNGETASSISREEIAELAKAPKREFIMMTSNHPTHDPKESFEEKNIIKQDYSSLMSDKELLKRVTEKPTSKEMNGRVRNNRDIEFLFRSGPDFLKNMFDIGFFIYKRHEDSKEEATGRYVVDDTDVVVGQFDTDIGKSIKDPENPVAWLITADVEDGDTKYIRTVKNGIDLTELRVRLASAELPMPSHDTFKTKFLQDEVVRVSSTTKFDCQSTLTFDNDANSYIHEMFQKLAGTWEDGKIRPTAGWTLNGKYRVDIVFKCKKNWTGEKLTNQFTDKPSYNNATRMYLTEDGRRTFNDYYYLQHPDIETTYIFEDCIFLGTEAGPKFQKENASLQQVEVPFIYRNFRQIYDGIHHEDADKDLAETRKAKSM